MITSFQIKGFNRDKDQLIERLCEAAGMCFKSFGQEGLWECTDDVVSLQQNGYYGRMKFVFRGLDGGK